MISYKKYSEGVKIPFYRKNEQITSKEVIVIDENGKNLGKLDINKALDIAKEKELDLVEVSPGNETPVCKIMMWSKFKYNLEKKRKKNSKVKAKEAKEIRFGPFITERDIETKIKKVKEFLLKKHPVKLTVRVKGNISKEIIFEAMERFLKKIEGFGKTDEEKKFEGKNLTMLIFPTKQK